MPLIFIASVMHLRVLACNAGMISYMPLSALHRFFFLLAGALGFSLLTYLFISLEYASMQCCS